MAKITKALIPAAGFGTRFLPQTKAMPKEMMPVVDKPIIQYVVEGLVDAGIRTIVIATGFHKRSIEDHFDNFYELEDRLEKAGKMSELEEVRKISDLAEFIYVRQKGPTGNATPILNAKHILGSEPFIVCWGDEFIDANPPHIKQLIDAYEKYEATILSGYKTSREGDYKRYGYAGGKEIEPGVIKTDRVVEKPGSRETSPSDLATLSSFVFTPDIYKPLEEAKEKLEEGQELVYLSGVQALIDQGKPVYTIEIKNANYHDTGNKLEYLKTVVEYGIKHEDIGKDFKDFLKDLKLD
jgi:UTP--glucose-1-phosphate uridylyltransferase